MEIALGRPAERQDVITSTVNLESVGAWAIAEIKKIDEKAGASKKAIIQEAARKLEGKIPTDRISFELSKQLRAVVSSRYIAESLDVKYKQKHRIMNAEKRRKVEKLAEHVLLNREEEFHSPQLVEQANGTVLVSKPDNDDEKIVSATPHSVSGKNSEPDGTEIGTIVTSPNCHSVTLKQDTELYAFSLPWKALQAYMGSIFSKNGTEGNVEFYVIISSGRKELLTAGFGKYLNKKAQGD